MIVVQQFQSLLYMMGASLVYLTMSATFTFVYRYRKFLFLVLFSSCIGLYLWQENMSPFLYGLYVVPNFLILALLVTMGLLYPHQQKRGSKSLQVFAYPVLLITTYEMINLLLCSSWDECETLNIVVSLIDTYVSSVYLSYIYHCREDHEQVRGQLNRTQQHQATNQLAKSMAHAIRNPLTITRGFLQLVNQKKLISEQVHTYCEHAESGIKEADEVIIDYLRCAEPEIKTPHRLHVQAEIDEKIIPQIAPLCAQSQIEIILRHLTNEPMYISGQSDAFCQSILNLITNAIEAMPAGGELEVTTWLNDKGVHIHIKDTGAGISKQKMKRIGTPFYDDMNEKGTGLGLMMVLSLVKAMNGTISYYSRPNEGTACLLQYKHAGKLSSAIALSGEQFFKGEKAMLFEKRFKEYENVSLKDADKVERAYEKKVFIIIYSFAAVVISFIVIKFLILDANRSVVETMAKQIKDKNVKIAVIHKGGHGDFSYEYFTGAKQEGESMGMKVDTFIANYDLTNFRYLLARAEKENYDGVIIDGGNGDVAEEIKKLVSKGIPVVTFDSTSELLKIKGITMTSQNDIEMMEYVLANMLKQLNGKGNISYLYTKTNPSWVTRNEIYEQFIKNTGINEVERFEVGQTEIFMKAKHAVAKMLKKHGKSEMDAIFVTLGEGEMASGAAEAVKEAGRKDIKVYAVGFTNADLYRMQAESSPYVSATGIDLKEIGAVNVRLLLKKIAGEETPSEYLFKPLLITQDKLRQIEEINEDSLKNVIRGWGENDDFEEDWMKKLKKSHAEETIKSNGQKGSQ